MRKLLLTLAFVILLGACDLLSVPIETQLQPGNDVIEVFSEWEDGGCVLLVGEESFSMERENDPDTSVLGETTVHYSYVYDEQTYQCIRVVKVVDTTPPIVVLNPGIDTISINEDYTNPGAVVTDNYDTEFVFGMFGDVDTSSPGTYYIEYHYRDSSDNLTVAVRVITVIQ